MSPNPPVTINAPVAIKVEQVDLLSVTGQLDDLGLDRLQCRLDELLDGGAKLLLADLSRSDRLRRPVVRHARAGRVFRRCRGGWLHLVGQGPPCSTASTRHPAEVLRRYRAARWAGQGVC